MSARPSRQTAVSLAVGCALVGYTIVMCLIGLAWLPCDPSSMDLGSRFASPSPDHLLGCDQFGRDILSRTMAAARPALAVGVLSVLAGSLAGTVLGFACGMAGRAARSAAMRAIDGLMAFPGILLAMMLVLVLGRGLTSALVAISMFMIPTFARLTCQLTLEVRGSLAVKAAGSYGAGRARIAFVHVLPAIAPRLVTQLSANAGSAMLLEASLSFLGLGVQPPVASWGYMLSEAMPYVAIHPQIAIAPGLALALCVLGFNLVGDALNDLLVGKGGPS